MPSACLCQPHRALWLACLAHAASVVAMARKASKPVLLPRDVAKVFGLPRQMASYQLRKAGQGTGNGQAWSRLLAIATSLRPQH